MNLTPHPITVHGVTLPPIGVIPPRGGEGAGGGRRDPAALAAKGYNPKVVAARWNAAHEAGDERDADAAIDRMLAEKGVVDR